MSLRRLFLSPPLSLLLAGGLLVLTPACSSGGGSAPPPVVVTPPSGLTFSLNPAVYTLGQMVPANTASHGGGTVVGYTVAPPLPAGLSLNLGTGSVSGTPTALAPVAIYTVTASNAGGNTTVALSITVNDQAPTSLAYGTPTATYTLGLAITPNLPTHAGGAIISYAVNPALPMGLALDAVTGRISGTPSLPTATATYTVTATNSGGSATADLTLTVNDLAPSGLSYATNPAVYTVGSAIADNVPTHSGGAVAAYSVSPSLPAGLSLHTGTGILSGTPAAPTGIATYTVTASNGGGSTTAALALTVNPLPRFAYVANTGDNTVSQFTVNAATGQLRHNGYVVAGTSPQAVAVTPSGKFAYVANSGSANVSAYSIQTSTGMLTPVGAPMAAGTNPYSVTVDPTGRFVYVANFGSNTVSAYTLDATTGALTSAGSVATGAQPLSVTVSASGTFAYVASNDNLVSAYSIHATTGALTAVSGSPFSTPLTGAARSVTVDPSGQFAYVAHGTSDNVSAYRINATTGALTAVAGSPFTAGTFPISVTVDPSGRFAYVAHYTSNNVIAYSIDPTTGALTNLGTRVAGTNPQSVSVDPSGKFAFVVNTGSGDISIYSVDAGNGTLTARATIAGRSGASGIAMTGGATPVTYAPTFAYVANSNGGNIIGSVSAYGVDATAGTLSAISGSPFASGWNTQGLTGNPAGTFAYVANYNPTLTGFSISGTGALAALPGSPFPAPASQSAWASAVDPSGRFAYFANYNNAGAGSVSAFTIHPTTGALTAMAGSAFPAGNGPAAIAIDPAGRFAYVANSYGNSVTAFTINATTGVLTRLDADPGTVGIQDFVAGSFPNSVAVDPTGRFVYVANSGDGTVSVYSITAATGALTRVDADAATAGIQNFNLGRVLTVAIDPAGRFAYFIKDGGFNQVLTYAIDAATGAIVASGAIGTGATPRAMALDAAGRFAYVANYAGNSLSVYRIDPVSGLLTEVVGSPFAISGATAPVAVVTTGTIQ